MWGDRSHCCGVSKVGRVMAKGDSSRAEPGLSFHEAMGMNTVGQEARALKMPYFLRT